MHGFVVGLMHSCERLPWSAHLSPPTAPLLLVAGLPVPTLLGAGGTRIAVVQQVGGEVEAPAEVQTGDMGVAWRRQGMCGEGGEQRQRLRQQERELASQPVRHSLWEQDSLEALNEVLGSLDGEVEALQQRKAEYDEERLSDGSDSCWSHSGSDSGSVTELEVGSEPALEGAELLTAQGGELVGVEQGHLQPGGKAPT